MITKNYICNKCKNQVTQADLLPIKIQIGNAGQETLYSTSDKAVEFDGHICKTCLVDGGFKISTGYYDFKTKEHNTATFESKIIDFLSDLGVAFVE